MLQTTAEPSIASSLDNKANNKHNQRKRDNIASAGVTGKNIQIQSIGAKSKNLSKSKKPNFAKTNSSKTDFFIFETKKAFAYLQKTFIKVPILYYFDPKHYIWIETDTFNYTIGRILSQLTPNQQFSDHLTFESSKPNFFKSKNSQWHSVGLFFQKMISAETHYKTHNQELLVIVEIFKT